MVAMECDNLLGTCFLLRLRQQVFEYVKFSSITGKVLRVLNAPTLRYADHFSVCRMAVVCLSVLIGTLLWYKCLHRSCSAFVQFQVSKFPTGRARSFARTSML